MLFKNAIKKKLLSKRGMTLPELIVATVVIVLVIAAACGALYFALQSLNSGAISVYDHENANVLEEYLKAAVSKAERCAIETEKIDFPTNSGTSLYFSDAGEMTVERDGKELAKINDIASLTINTAPVGEGNSTRVRLEYKIIGKTVDTMSIELDGSVVLLNSDPDPTNPAEITDVTLDALNNPGYLNIYMRKDAVPGS